MKAEDDEDDFPAMGRALSRLKAVREAVYYGPSWNEAGFMELGRAILDVFQLSRDVEDSMGVRAKLARQYLWVVCPELSLPCGLHSEMLYAGKELRNALENPPERWEILP